MLSRADFVDAVAARMQLEVAELSALSFEALGLDSIRLYELDLVVESLGVLLPEEVIVTMQRIDDVYQAYVVEASSGAAPETGS